MRTVEVEIDESGGIHPVEPVSHFPPGRAILIWPPGDENELALMSEAALAADWLRPEEDEAWAYMSEK